jgi:hypothetical protein
LEPIEGSFQGKARVDKAITKLNNKISEFLKEYDTSGEENRGDGKINITELENARKKLTDDLRTC